MGEGDEKESWRVVIWFGVIIVSTFESSSGPRPKTRRHKEKVGQMCTERVDSEVVILSTEEYMGGERGVKKRIVVRRNG